jgi:transcriptional regulator
MMYSIEFNEMVYWFQSEDQFKKAFDNKGNDLLKYSDLAFNNATREIVKCRYDLKEIISSWMYRRSHEDKMKRIMENDYMFGADKK